jgi:hypothetical protein
MKPALCTAALQIIKRLRQEIDRLQAVQDTQPGDGSTATLAAWVCHTADQVKAAALVFSTGLTGVTEVGD